MLSAIVPSARQMNVTRTRWLTWSVLLVLLLRAWIPVGFMPGQSAHGVPVLRFCEGHQHPRGAPGAPRHAGSDSDRCPFAAAPGLAPASSIPAAPVTASGVVLALALESQAPPQPRLWRAHGARAPPVCFIATV